MFQIEKKQDKDGQWYLPVALRGYELLQTPKLNKGSAFSELERKALGLIGRLPYEVETLADQVSRCYQQFSEVETKLSKNIYLNALHDNNETLFYALLTKYLEEMLPIIYTPIVGDAVENFSLEERRARGLFVSYPDINSIDEMMLGRINQEIDLVLVTDGEGVLGIGDWGVGGIHIAIAKLMVYTACSGLDPNRVLPVQLDVGTNNEKLLNDPEYLGWRHKRINGKDYDKFIDTFVSAVRKNCPNAYLHWEDFGKENARKNLLRYRDEMPTFNDDMQGTGAVALACILSGLVAKNASIRDQRVVFFGAGTAGCGIADQIVHGMMREGLSEDEASQRIYLVDRAGLLHEGMQNIASFQQPYTHTKQEIAAWDIESNDGIGLLDTVKNVKPTILIGCSTVKGAFNEAVVKAMMSHCERPIILPLSNPTSHSEATAADLIHWTKGSVLMALGSPYEPVTYDDKQYVVSQSNNAFIFPGLGRGVIVSKASRVTDEMIFAACEALSLASPARQDPAAPLLPNIAHASKLADDIALAVAHKAREQGLSQVPEEADFAALLAENKWIPVYYPYHAE